MPWGYVGPHVFNICYVFYEMTQQAYINGLVQDCSISSALAMEILQSCTKPSISLQSFRPFTLSIFHFSENYIIKLSFLHNGGLSINKSRSCYLIIWCLCLWIYISYIMFWSIKWSSSDSQVVLRGSGILGCKCWLRSNEHFNMSVFFQFSSPEW